MSKAPTPCTRCLIQTTQRSSLWTKNIPNGCINSKVFGLGFASRKANAFRRALFRREWTNLGARYELPAVSSHGRSFAAN